MLEDLDLEYFKLLKKYLIDRLKKYNDDLEYVEIQLNNFKKCECCKEPHILKELRILTNLELDLIQDYDQEQCDNYSCYNCFYEDSLYCESCIKYKTRIENKN